jgi:putative nucleotidyltransferase with HDIG domain
MPTVQSNDFEVLLKEWRSRTLTVILIVVSVIVLPAIAITTARLAQIGEWNWIAFLAGMYTVLLVLTIFRRLDYRVRSAAALLTGYVGAAFALLIDGLAGDGRIFLTLLPILAFVLIGLRSGWIATAFSLVAYFIFGISGDVGMFRGFLESSLLAGATPFGTGFWFMTWATLVALLLPAMTLLDRFHRLQLRSLRAEQRATAKLALAYDATLGGLARALEVRDQDTEGHSQRVSELTLELARAFGIIGDELEQVRRGAILHDIGKIGIPDNILHKPGPLSPDEWEIMRKHPEYAYRLLSPIQFLTPALEIPYCHHERWNGSGYPRKLSGEQIPLSARVFAVADVWDALLSDRSYRKGWSEERAREYIASNAGIQFDPKAVAVFMEIG